MEKIIKKKKGFTLIELLVTIAVLGILVLLASPRFFGHIQKAELTKGIANSKSIEKASELYYMDHEDWPRLTDFPYTSEEIESYSERVYDRTGHEVSLDPEGNYYDIDYDKLSDYVQIPDDKRNYILQNPVGKVFYMENLSAEGEKYIQNPTAREVEMTGAGTGMTTLTIPYTGVYRIVARGGQGGRGGDLWWNNYGGGIRDKGFNGENGQLVSGDFKLNRGDTIYIYQGGTGETGSKGYSQYNDRAGGGSAGDSSYVAINETSNKVLQAPGGMGGTGGSSSSLSGGSGRLPNDKVINLGLNKNPEISNIANGKVFITTVLYNRN